MKKEHFSEEQLQACPDRFNNGRDGSFVLIPRMSVSSRIIQNGSFRNSGVHRTKIGPCHRFAYTWSNAYASIGWAQCLGFPIPVLIWDATFTCNGHFRLLAYDCPYIG